MALNPPCLFCFFFCSFPFLEKPCFSPQKREFLFSFECLTVFLLSLFWPDPFSLSLSLSLSLSFYFLSSFLLVFLFCFLLVSCFVSFFLFVSSLLLFHEKNNIKKFNDKVLFIGPFSLLLVSSLLFSFKSPFLIFAVFLILSLIFCSTSKFFFQRMQVQKTPIFGQEGGCNITFFLITCV